MFHFPVSEMAGVCWLSPYFSPSSGTRSRCGLTGLTYLYSNTGWSCDTTLSGNPTTADSSLCRILVLSRKESVVVEFQLKVISKRFETRQPFTLAAPKKITFRSKFSLIPNTSSIVVTKSTSPCQVYHPYLLLRLEAWRR
jgi:hypothetical protein